MTVTTPIKRGTAMRLGLEPPHGPFLGVVTASGAVLSPEEYQEFQDRFAKAVKGGWQFVYLPEVGEERAKRQAGRSWWAIGGRS